MKYLSFFFIMVLFLLVDIQAAFSDDSSDSLEMCKRHFSFAVLNKNNGNYEESLTQYKKSLSYCDTLYNIHYSFGDLLLKMGKMEAAGAHLLRAYDLKKDDYNVNNALAKFYYDCAKYDSSLVFYENLYSLKPQNQLLASIAGLKEYVGQEDKAYEDYLRIIDQGVATYDILIKAARLAKKQSDNEKARTYAIMALEKKPGDIAALSIAAQTSMDINDNFSASGFLRQMALQDSTNLAILSQLEKTYKETADNDNLLWALKRHNELAPSDPEVIGELSELLYSRDDLAAALVFVKKGLEINPSDGRFHILLGENYKELGQTEKALVEYRLALTDEKWKSSAQRLIWQIEKPESSDDKKEKEFFNRAKK